MDSAERGNFGTNAQVSKFVVLLCLVFRPPQWTDLDSGWHSGKSDTVDEYGRHYDAPLPLPKLKLKLLPIVAILCNTDKAGKNIASDS